MELLVATALLVVLFLMLSSVYLYMAETYTQTEARTDSFRDGRAALHLMSDELESLVDAHDMQTNTNAAALPLIEVSSNVSGTNASIAFVSRLSQRLQPDDGTNNLSDVCIVGYFLAPNTNGSYQGQSLYRCLIPSADTYERLTNGGTNLLTADDENPANNYVEPVADNVIDFEVRTLDSQFNVIDDPSTATNQTYVQVILDVIGVHSAPAYFNPGASAALRSSITNKEARSFTLCSRLAVMQN